MAKERLRIVMIHGAATTAKVWAGLGSLLADVGSVVAPQRRYTGDWETELDDLIPECEDAFVVGVSGGATLGLELATRGVRMRGAVLHEPAAGSLAPGLLDAVAAAFVADGPEGFGRALYGDHWSIELAPDDLSSIGRDLAMFRSFEPSHPIADSIAPLLTVGQLSPEIRHRSVSAIADLIGAPIEEVANAAHAVHIDNRLEFASVIVGEIERTAR